MTQADDVVIAVTASQAAAAVGTVVETGERAGGFAGKRVLAGPIDPCGECEVCRRGGAPVCPHARRRSEPLPDRIVAAARWLVPLDGALVLPDPHAAAVAGDVALAYTLYARTGLAPREPVVVVGASPITRFLVEILLAKSITPVVVTPVGPFHDWLAARGATPVTDRTQIQFPERTRPWRVIATTADAAPLAAELAGPRATLTVLAPVAALPAALADREVTVIAVAGAHPDLVTEVAAMCVKGELDLAGGTSESRNELMQSIVHVR